MNKIKIDTSKHIAFLIYPRSGTTILRSYLCNLLGYRNASEIFNHHVTGTEIIIEDNRIVKWFNTNARPNLSVSDLIKRSHDYLNTLSKLTEINEFAVFSVFADSFYRDDHTILSELSKRSDIQFIRQERADLLYAILSIMVGLKTDTFHNLDKMSKSRNMAKSYFDPDFVLGMLTKYVEEKKEINKYFPDTPIIYYEEFQMSPIKMMYMFDGIPRKILNLEFSKFSENYKNLVVNLEEIENLYEKFVNDNIEFFPQYSGIYNIEIPKHQGRQPRYLKAA